MELHEALKKLKEIKPDHEYAARSRNLLLRNYETRIARPANAWQFILQNLQAGSVMALAGILLLLVAGGFSNWTFLSPLGLSSLDPSSLRAEADAIDIQI